MNSQHFFSAQSRRDFLKRCIVTGSMLQFSAADLLGFSAMKVNEEESPAIVFEYRTMSVDHLSQLQKDIDKRNRLLLFSNTEPCLLIIYPNCKKISTK